MKELIELCKELLARLKMESPETFKKLQKWSAIIGTLLAVFLAAYKGFDMTFLDSVIPFINISTFQILTYLNILIAGVFVSARLPVKNPEELKK